MQVLLGLLLLLHLSFAKNNLYTVKLERVECDSVDYTHVNITGGVTFFNRTVRTLNLHFDKKEAFTEKSAVQLIANKWINNNWVRYSSIQIHDSTKNFMALEWFDMPHYYGSFKPPARFPWKAGIYVLKDFIFNSQNWPPYIPTGYYKGEVGFYESNKKERLLFQLDFYCHLIPIIKRKN